MPADLDYMLQGEDYDDDEEGDEDAIELLGALDPILGARMFKGGRRGLRRRLKRALVPRTPGVPTPGGRQQPLGFEPAQFTDASALVLELIAEVDRPFKGNRLIIEAVRSASGIGGLLTVRRFDIGGKNQLASRQPVIFAAFENTATITLLALDPLTPGVPAVLEIEASVQPTTAATVDVGACLYGLSIS